MKKLFILIICLTICGVNGAGVFAKEIYTTVTLPAVVAQSSGQANTVIMWHDINDDGKADFKATYVFKDGKLQRLYKGSSDPGELKYIFRER